MRIYKHKPSLTTIVVNGNEANCFDTLRKTRNKKQYLKTDGQGNEYITRFGKKIKLKDCDEVHLISFVWKNQKCTFDSFHKPITEYLKEYEALTFEEDLIECEVYPDGTGHISLDYEYDGVAVFTTDDIGDYGLKAIVDRLNNGWQVGFFGACYSLLKKYYPNYLDKVNFGK